MKVGFLFISVWQRTLQDPGQRVVVALQDYSPLGDNDLPLQKDQEYILTDNSHSDWWMIQDDKGYSTSGPPSHSLLLLSLFSDAEEYKLKSHLCLRTTCLFSFLSCTRNTGFVPSTYVAEKSGANFDRFE